MFGIGKPRPSIAICYLRRDRVFFHALSGTVAGFYVATPPWLAVDLEDIAGLDVSIQAALAGSKTNVPTPSRDANPLAALYDLAGVKTWGGFAANARSVHIEQTGKAVTFRPMRNLGARNGFQPIPELAFEVASGQAVSTASLKALDLAQ